MSHSRLDLTAKLYQPSVMPTALGVAHGDHPAGPLVVDLDPTSFCDLACPECINSELINKGRFTDDRLMTLADELIAAGVRAVLFIGGGEPLVHPSTSRAIRHFAERGVRVGVVTNGTRLDRHQAELSAHVDWVRVSVDAGTSETYREFRPSRTGASLFDHVIANMKEYAATKKGSLGYSFLLMSRPSAPGRAAVSNHEEVLTAARLAKSIGCDYFELKTMLDPHHYVIDLPDEVLDSVNSQVEAARSLEDNGFSIECSSNYAAVSNKAGSLQPKEYSTCYVAELRTLVTPSGVFTCAYHRGDQMAKLGDAVSESFRDVWLTRSSSVVNPSLDCPFHCAHHPMNLEMLRLSLRLDDPVVGDADYDLFI